MRIAMRIARTAQAITITDSLHCGSWFSFLDVAVTVKFPPKVKDIVQ